MIGQRIKERRQEMNLSLRDLGELTGLTASFLSQIENELTEPSITSLQKIATALKVPMFTFLNGGTKTEQVVRSSARKRLSFPEPHLEYELLSSDLNHQMAGFLIHLKAGETHHAQQLYKSTEEIMYVMRGELEIWLEDRQYLLHPGDSIHYEGAHLKNFTATGKDDLVVLCVITPPVL